MENIEEKVINVDEPKKKWKWGWMLIDYAILQTIGASTDEKHLFIGALELLSFFVAPLFYYRVRAKIKLKNESGFGAIVYDIFVGLGIIVASIILISVLGGIGDKLFL